MRGVVVKALGCIGLLAMMSCSSEGPITPTNLSLELVSGDNQSGVVNTELPNPLVVKATNNGAAIAGLTVNFVVVSGGGAMYAGAASTDNTGKAVDYWTLGTSTSEDQRVEVRAVLSNGQKQVFGVFTAVALPGPVSSSRSTIDASPAGIPGGSATTITVAVEDDYSNWISGAAVVVFATGSGNTITQPSNTNANGVTTGSLSSTVAEIKTVSATANGTPITQTAEVAFFAGPPTQIAVNAGDNQTAPMGTAVAIPPSVIVKDQYGNAAASIDVTFAPTVGSGRVTAGGTSTDAQGIAAVGSWILGCGATSKLVATATGSGISGNPVTFTALGSNRDCWSIEASVPDRRYTGGVGVVNGILYFVGGTNDYGGGKPYAPVDAYDPTTDSWTTKASMPTPRAYLGVGVVNGILYAVGGSSSSSSATATVEAYDPTTDSWTTKASMPTPRSGLGVGVVNGILYAVGGVGSSVPALGSVEAYDPTTDTWTTKSSMPTPRYYIGVGVVNGILYALGGINNAQMATVEAYNPTTNTWTTKASMTKTRAFLGVGVGNGILYAVGGAVSPDSTVEAYDPTTDLWATKASMPTPRSGFGVGVVNGILYALAGYRSYANEAYHP